uniref:Collagen alpha-1(XX) chain n=2 Tax=Pan troglodytes TaxID=9598 RepID=G2HFA7_PANTR|nr:collagen alpha-1(XX) chain precursor [Pan troglodytes]
MPILEQKLEPGTEPLGSPGTRSKALVPGEWGRGGRHLEGRGTGLLALGEGVVAGGGAGCPLVLGLGLQSVSAQQLLLEMPLSSLWGAGVRTQGFPEPTQSQSWQRGQPRPGLPGPSR